MKDLSQPNLPSPICLSPQIYAIGKYLFQLSSEDLEFLKAVADSFVPFDQSWARQRCLTDPGFSPLPDAINIDRLCQRFHARPWDVPVLGFVLWCIMDRAVEHHIQFYPNDVALEAALLITPTGTPVWLSGSTQAGKTTLVVALAVGLNWKIVSEDFVFINEGKPVPLVAPLSLRPAAPAIIEAATGIRPPVAGNRWFIRPDLFYTEDMPSALPVAIHLSLTKANVDLKLNLRHVAWTEYLRTVLPVSNAPKVTGGIDRLAKAFENGRCMVLKDGNLRSRLAAMSDL